MRLITEIQIINYVITSFYLIEKAYEKIKNGLSFEILHTINLIEIFYGFIANQSIMLWTVLLVNIV